MSIAKELNTALRPRTAEMLAFVRELAGAGGQFAAGADIARPELDPARSYLKANYTAGRLKLCTCCRVLFLSQQWPVGLQHPLKNALEYRCRRPT